MEGDVVDIFNEENKEIIDDCKENVRIKSALYYAIGKMCEQQLNEKKMTFTKGYLASLNQVVFSQGELIARDLESFCRHAKRTIVNMDDVKMVARRNENLTEILDECSKKITEEQKCKGKGRKRKADHITIDDDNEVSLS